MRITLNTKGVKMKDFTVENNYGKSLLINFKIEVDCQVNGDEYPVELSEEIELDLTEEEFYLIAQAAHIKNVTINDFMLQAVQEAISEKNNAVD